MSDIAAYLDERRRGRAARRTVSVELAVHATALVLLAAADLAWVGVATPAVLLLPTVYVVLWVVGRVRARPTGTGRRDDGFGGLAVAAVVLTFFLAPVAFLGVGTLLGLGLLALAVVQREALPALAGAPVAVVSPFVHLHVVDNHLWWLLGPRPGALLTLLLAAGVAALAVRARRHERDTLLRPVPA